MTRFMSRDSDGRDRSGVVNIARKAKPFLARIIMVTEKVIGFHDSNVVNLRRLQYLAGGFGAGHIGTSANSAPFPECCTDTKLCPKSDDQRNTNEEKPIVTEEKSTTRIEQKKFFTYTPTYLFL